MDAMLQNLITNLPNFAVALVMLWWQKQTIDQLLENQKALIDRLLQYVDKDKQTVNAAIAAQVATNTAITPPNGHK